MLQGAMAVFGIIEITLPFGFVTVAITVAGLGGQDVKSGKFPVWKPGQKRSNLFKWRLQLQLPACQIALQLHFILGCDLYKACMASQDNEEFSSKD